MRILIVGAGATGGYFGARLQAAGRDVRFLVRPRRAAQLRATGLQVRSPHGDLSLQPALEETGVAPEQPADAVLLAVKAYTLDGAMDDLLPHVGADTVIMPLLNGMAHLPRLIARFGEAAVLGGVCRVATTLDAEGRILQLAPFQELSFGERDGTMSPRVAALHGALDGAGFKAEAASNILQQMWDKWVLLASGGALCCLFGSTVGPIEAAGGADTARALVAEAVSVAAAAGFAPSAAVRGHCEGMLTAAGSGFATSMYRDMVAGAPVEADHIVGDMVRRGEAAGAAVPLLRAASVALRMFEARRPAG